MSSFRWRSCCSLCRSACCARLSGRDAASVDRLVGCFPLCSRCVSVGGLRTANVFPVFALAVSMGRVVVFFMTASFPSDTALACPIAAVAANVHGNSLACSPGVRCDRFRSCDPSPFFMTASVHGGGCCPPLSACGIGGAAGEPGRSGSRMWGLFFVPHPPSVFSEMWLRCLLFWGSAASSFPPVVSWSGHSRG